MSVYSVKRDTKKGPRWYVRVEIPARAGLVMPNGETPDRFPIIHLGTFTTEKAAKTAIKSARDQMEAGRIPVRFPELHGVAPKRTMRQVAEEWIATRHDIKQVTRAPYERMIRTWPSEIADLDPQAVTRQDIQAWVTFLTTRPKRRGKNFAQVGLLRGSIARELGVLKLVLDYAGRTTDNPARDRTVKLPRRERGEYRLPTRQQILELHQALPTRVPLMTLLEHTGLRIHEAANLQWADIDHARARLLVRESKTASGRRFVDRLPETPEFPVIPEGVDPSARVFPRARSFTNVLRETHERRGTFLMSAHEWRHLHASRLLHDQILSPAQIAARMGHADPGITLRTYTHIVPPD